MFCLDAIGPIKRRVIRELQENGQIGYEGETPEPMIAEITVEITGILARVSDYAGSDSPMLIDGNPNLVIWDGTPYRCVTTGSKSNSTSVYIGNVYRVSPDYENTGEPFCIQINRTGGRASVYGEPGTHTLEIQNLVKTIHPSDPKYLPGPVVIDLDKYEITTHLLQLFQSGGGTVDMVNMEDFWEAVKTDSPMRVSFAFNAYSRVNVTGVTTVTHKSKVLQLCFECIMDYSGAVYRVAAMIANDNGNNIAANVTVRVAPV